MNICRKCAHHRAMHGGDFCQHPIVAVDNVTGDPSYIDCSSARTQVPAGRWEGFCGPTGKHYERKDKADALGAAVRAIRP